MIQRLISRNKTISFLNSYYAILQNMETNNQKNTKGKAKQTFHYVRKDSNNGHETKQSIGNNILQQPQNKLQKICQFYQIGTCKFGTECRNSHIDQNKNDQMKKEKQRVEVQNPIEKYKNYKKEYVFDPNLTLRCQQLAQIAREEKEKGYKLQKEDELIIHSPSELGDQQNCNMVLIRHAMSESNYIQSKYTQGIQKEKLKKFKQHFRYFLYKDNNLFMDTPLHPIGIKQCEDIQKHNYQINYQTVYVSPLRRTLQTCIELFKNHPLRGNINFIIYPDIAEMLKKDSDIFLVDQFNQLIQEAKEKYNMHFDTETFFEPDWQFNHINTNQHLKNVTYTPQLLKSLIVQGFPQPLENFNKFQERIKKATRRLKQIQKEKKELTGVITHSLVAREFISNEDMENDEEIENLAFIYFNNK
ncbi:histidine phosphatase family (branch protein 1) (macronuclear) [Tetrahymena thermophila SB210]|uniref:Histidine phosphatase family (Branch protein 1) n=1 Tax=Tetrahymena thermophila (strain SB210) TaxID=312017 RepID=I7MMS7_TETTS|nr:histidine phosphatase family (branch protein 1) [Tetrahymena thermophila SB210]EAS06325.2 histidine phosphatase family (branch protein 1) [Tetrahymena thermophila SB210]|eukprot:XP_001026570.2 histidine phosphatase family (branch protein 1) [Tetrahymena thermophila SB210]